MLRSKLNFQLFTWGYVCHQISQKKKVFNTSRYQNILTIYWQKALSSIRLWLFSFFFFSMSDLQAPIITSFSIGSDKKSRLIFLLELRQYKNNSDQFDWIPRLKLPPFSSCRIGDEKVRQFQMWNSIKLIGVILILS